MNLNFPIFLAKLFAVNALASRSAVGEFAISIRAAWIPGKLYKRHLVAASRLDQRVVETFFNVIFLPSANFCKIAQRFGDSEKNTKSFCTVSKNLNVSLSASFAVSFSARFKV